MRCAAFSLVLTGLVMLLRKMLFSERIFLKGMLWAVFLVTPFLGKLKLFYENAAICKATWWMTKGTMSCLWVGRIYTMGILVAVICVFGKRLRLRRLVAGMEKVFFDGIRISVTDMNITPFTIGLLKPKIVLPKTMADSYSREELKAIIQHEQTHIRLGHLWFGLAWDMLRCLLWINPFLTVFQKHFRADMEDIIEKAQGYGFSIKNATVGTKVLSGSIVGPTEDEFAAVVAQAMGMSLVKGVCSISKKLSYMAPRLLPVLPEGKRTRHLSVVFLIFLFQCVQKP